MANSEELKKLKKLQEQVNFLADQTGLQCSDCGKCFNGNAQCSRCMQYTCEECGRYENSQTWFCNGECKVEYFRRLN